MYNYSRNSIPWLASKYTFRSTWKTALRMWRTSSTLNKYYKVSLLYSLLSSFFSGFHLLLRVLYLDSLSLPLTHSLTGIYSHRSTHTVLAPAPLFFFLFFFCFVSSLPPLPCCSTVSSLVGYISRLRRRKINSRKMMFVQHSSFLKERSETRSLP